MKQILEAMLDDEFKKILESDPVLDELEKEKYNDGDEYFALMSILSPVFFISGVTVTYITPAIWAYLYACKNAYARNTPVTETDTDLVMFILHNGLSKMDDKFLEKSFRFCAQNKIDYVETKLDIIKMIQTAFRPLEMFPRTGGAECVFDADWLTRISSIASQMSGRTSKDVMHNMSLTEACYYYVQHARKDDINNVIRRRDSDEVTKAIYDRYFELGSAYWKTHYAGDK